MASNAELYNQNHLQRSFSECIQEENKSEETVNHFKMTRKSETSDDNRELEDIVTCSIHLGIMEDPKKLFCQHAFCYKCLKEYAKTCVDLICPICRIKEKITDVDKLPSALTEKQLIDVVMKHRLNKCLEDTPSSVSLSDDRKEELVKHLLNDINSKNGVYKVHGNKNEDVKKEMSNNLMQLTPYLEIQRSESRTSLTYDMMDIETIRESMLKHSQYEIVKRDVVQKIYKHLYQNKTENFRLDFSIFDIIISENNPRSNQLVLVDLNTNLIVVYSESQLRTFHIYFDDKVVKADYIRLFRGNMILSGRLEREEEIISIFLQCDMNGQIIHKSESYVWPERSVIPMILGFDINEKEDKYYLCMPKTGNVRIFNTSLVEFPQCYEFDDNQPEYIAFYATQNQLWISCPSNKRILILDIDSGVFRLFNTEQINRAIPKMIFVTDDDKIIFLDVKGNRFIWIKRRNEYILTQKLNIPTINRDSKIKAFQILPFSMIIIAIENEILIYQSAKYFSKSRRIFELCTVV